MYIHIYLMHSWHTYFFLIFLGNLVNREFFQIVADLQNVFQYIYGKKSKCKWSHVFQTHAVQGSTVLWTPIKQHLIFGCLNFCNVTKRRWRLPRFYYSLGLHNDDALIPSSILCILSPVWRKLLDKFFDCSEAQWD